MSRAFEWLYRRLGKRYFLLYVLFEFPSGAAITFATVGLFSLYEDIASAPFWRVVLVAEASVAVAMLYAVHRTKELALPLLPRSSESSRVAWRSARDSTPGPWSWGRSAAAGGSSSR